MKDMLGRENVITSDRALNLLCGALSKKRTAITTEKIENSLGMVCAEDVVSGDDLPAFARSTVDGYAVRAGDAFGHGLRGLRRAREEGPERHERGRAEDYLRALEFA